MNRLLPQFGAGPTVGVVLLALFFIAALTGPWFAPYGPEAQNLGHLLEKPSHAHLLGTDENGCDVLSQLLYGARLAARLSPTILALCLVIGIAAGTIAGYFGGVVDEIIMRFVDVLLAFPGILLNLA